jgi:RNA polymerase sigma-70 factor (ECF subfamily)
VARVVVASAPVGYRRRMTEARVAGAGAWSRSSTGDVHTLAALRAGDQEAFMRLVDAYGAQMLRLARTYVADAQAAEEVVQETWLAVCTGLGRFEGRSSLKTWIFQILVNRARTRGLHESRSVPFSSLSDDGDDHAVAPDRFHDAGSDRPGQWVSHPQRFEDLPDRQLESDEAVARVRGVIRSLVPMQRAVITLRDVDGWDADEVCAVLGVTAANQRVLLHRARTRVRRALEAMFEGEKGR